MPAVDAASATAAGSDRSRPSTNPRRRAASRKARARAGFGGGHRGQRIASSMLPGHGSGQRTGGQAHSAPPAARPPRCPAARASVSAHEPNPRAANTAPSSTGSHTTSQPSTASTRSAASHAYGEPTSTKKRDAGHERQSISRLRSCRIAEPPHARPRTPAARRGAEVGERLDAQHDDRVAHELHAVVERVRAGRSPRSRPGTTRSGRTCRPSGTSASARRS